MTSKKLTPDKRLLLAVEIAATAANIHRLRNLLLVYIGYCDLGFEDSAEAAKNKLYALLRSNSSC